MGEESNIQANELARLAGFAQGFPPCTNEDMDNVMDLIIEHWSLIKRATRRCPTVPLVGPINEGNSEGYVTSVNLSKVIMSETAMARRDVSGVFGVLTQVTKKYTQGGIPLYLVYMPDLWRFLHNRISKLPDGTPREDNSWKVRFRAAGAMDSKIQFHTTGVEKSGNTYRQLYQGPPYAISGDSEHMHDMITDYFKVRSDWMKCEMVKFALTYPKDELCLSRMEFKEALTKRIPDRYGIPEREIIDLLTVLDPSRSNRVYIDEFIRRFGFEFLKHKSMRNTVGVNNNDGATNTFQWAASLQQCKTKKDLIEELRNRRTTPRSVQQSRASYLRKNFGKQQREAMIDLETKHYSLIQSALKIEPPAHLSSKQRQILRDNRFKSPTTKEKELKSYLQRGKPIHHAHNIVTNDVLRGTDLRLTPRCFGNAQQTTPRGMNSSRGPSNENCETACIPQPPKTSR